MPRPITTRSTSLCSSPTIWGRAPPRSRSRATGSPSCCTSSRGNRPVAQASRIRCESRQTVLTALRCEHRRTGSRMTRSSHGFRGAARPLVALVLAVTLPLALLTACTSAADNRAQPNTPAPSATTPASTTPEPAETPKRGGTLKVVASGIDYLDPNISYYSLGYSMLREFSRQLYTSPADAANPTAVVPDLATGPPTVDASRTVYTVTIRPGAKWDTAPPRQVTAEDAVRGVGIICNPAQPFGGLPDFVSLIKGMQEFCQEFSRVKPTAQAIRLFL